MSTAEIAGILGRSEGAVRVLIHRALGSVARELGQGPPGRTRSPRRGWPRDLPVRADAGTDVDALVTDRYLDALLAAADRRADDAPSDADLDPGVRDAARVLGRSLVRVHPSFRFEERLASRLAGLAAAQARMPSLPRADRRRTAAIAGERSSPSRRSRSARRRVRVRGVRPGRRGPTPATRSCAVTSTRPMRPPSSVPGACPGRGAR